jgi:hypothetical protein
MRVTNFRARNFTLGSSFRPARRLKQNGSVNSRAACVHDERGFGTAVLMMCSVGGAALKARLPRSSQGHVHRAETPKLLPVLRVSVNVEFN